MTQYLPPNLLALFAARDPLPFKLPPDKLPHERKTVPLLGLGAFVHDFEDPNETPAPTRVETKEEKKERKKKERAEAVAYKLEQDLALWDPTSNVNSTTDPYKTLFVARVNYDTSESKLKREFEKYGAVKKISVINCVNTGKPRGYAFIEYEHERDMHSAYKHADGMKIDGRRVVVDVERARTVKGWRPRRLGGGMGGTRKGGPDVNTKYSGREESEREERRERDRTRSRSRDKTKRRDRDRDRERPERGERQERERPERERDKDRGDRERIVDRDRERGERERGDRDRDVERRKRSRERDERKKRRSRSRERRRSRSRDRNKRARRSRDREGAGGAGPELPHREENDEFNNGQAGWNHELPPHVEAAAAQ